MSGRDWSEVVEEAVRRHVDSTGDPVFTRQDLRDSQLSWIVSETGSEGETPHQTLSRELRAMGYRKLSARLRHHAQAAGAIETFKNMACDSGGDRAPARP